MGELAQPACWRATSRRRRSPEVHRPDRRHVIWTASRETEKPNSFKLIEAADTSPSHLSTEQSYKSSVVWGTGLSSDSTRAGRVPQLQLLLWFLNPGITITFFTSLMDRWQSARPVPFDMDAFSLLFLIAALIFLSLGLGALCHYILVPYLRCVLWVRANFNQDTNNTCWNGWNNCLCHFVFLLLNSVPPPLIYNFYPGSSKKSSCLPQGAEVTWQLPHAPAKMSGLGFGIN